MITLDEALLDPNLLGAALGDAETWAMWLVVARAIKGLDLNRQERRAFASIAGSRKPPRQKVRELWAIVGRRSGKSRLAAAILVYIALFEEHKLAPGEVGYVLSLSPTLSQAQLVFSYCLAFIQSSPILAKRIVSYTSTEIKLTGNIVISTHANSFRSIRGRTLLACVFDESAFWRDELSASPDIETYRAVLPALATTDGLLVGISSPWRQSGLLYDKHKASFGVDDEDVLVVQGSTEQFNPTISKKLIAQSYKDDPIAAASEWGGLWRSDLQAFLDEATINAAVDHTRPMELAPEVGTQYSCFVDASAGRADSFTICIGHQEDGLNGPQFVAAALRAVRPPFDPESVAIEFATLAKQYRISTVVGDSFAGEWVAQAFRKQGLDYQKARLNKSGLYLESLPHWMRFAVSIPNNEVLIRELRLLERSTRTGGRDVVDHPKSPGFHDDLANSLCGCIHLVMGELYEEVVATGGAWTLCNGEFVNGGPSFLKPERPLKVDLTSEMGGAFSKRPG
jgi:hypothetical protein